MTENEQPEPIANVINENGILPGIGWPSDILNNEDAYEMYFAGYVFPFDDDPTLASVIDHAVHQWHDLFPNATEADRMMFIAGVLAMQYWFSAISIRTRNNAGVGVHGECGLLIGLDDLELWVAQTVVRIVSILHSIDDDAKADLDDSFADIVESIKEGD